MLEANNIQMVGSRICSEGWVMGGWVLLMVAGKWTQDSSHCIASALGIAPIIVRYQEARKLTKYLGRDRGDSDHICLTYMLNVLLVDAPRMWLIYVLVMV